LISGIDFIVSGHTPLDKPLFQNKQLFIDTGCGHVASRAIPNPHLTICEFQKKHIIIYALSEQFYERSTIEI
jgi:serine/threonine protein phosphatase 1